MEYFLTSMYFKLYLNATLKCLDEVIFNSVMFSLRDGEKPSM